MQYYALLTLLNRTAYDIKGTCITCRAYGQNIYTTSLSVIIGNYLLITIVVSWYGTRSW